VALGIARTFQNIRLFGSMTVLDNVKLGFHARTETGWMRAMLRWRLTNQEERETDSAARALLDDLDLGNLAAENAKNLAYGNQRRLEIARALASRPRLLLLDEPAAGLNEAESRELIGRIRAIRNQGITVIIVEHDMRLVMNLCDRITVLAHGEKIAEGTPQEVQNDQRVRIEYLGKKVDHAQGTAVGSLLRKDQSA
jgi:branched-chain amino acid transport system ATP-binding protein